MTSSAPHNLLPSFSKFLETYMASSSPVHVDIVQYGYVTSVREDPSLPGGTICNVREHIQLRVWVYSQI